VRGEGVRGFTPMACPLTPGPSLPLRGERGEKRSTLASASWLTQTLQVRVDHHPDEPLEIHLGRPLQQTPRLAGIAEE
jgi:hypothetical protein